ncbi:MAG: hypothetical protein KJN90_03795 [Gammaproteobacteria bacterium]|nr:hypothetical protein [Gammaproteobacteria bacterium]
MSDTGKKPDASAHKLGADRHDPAKKPTKKSEDKRGRHKTSKDIREDRGIRQHKLGEHKN